jgi:hypothetical protein
MLCIEDWFMALPYYGRAIKAYHIRLVVRGGDLWVKPIKDRGRHKI